MFRVFRRLLRCGIPSRVPHHISRPGLPRKLTPWGTSYKGDHWSQFDWGNIQIEVDLPVSLLLIYFTWASFWRSLRLSNCPRWTFSSSGINLRLNLYIRHHLINLGIRWLILSQRWTISSQGALRAPSIWKTSILHLLNNPHQHTGLYSIALRKIHAIGLCGRRMHKL